MTLREEEYIEELQVAILQKKDLTDYGFETILLKKREIGAVLVNRETRAIIIPNSAGYHYLSSTGERITFTVEQVSGGSISIVLYHTDKDFFGVLGVECISYDEALEKNLTVAYLKDIEYMEVTLRGLNVEIDKNSNLNTIAESLRDHNYFLLDSFGKVMTDCFIIKGNK